MEEFFLLPTDVKKLNTYSGVTENLGYNWLEKERLTPAIQKKVNIISQGVNESFNKLLLWTLFFFIGGFLGYGFIATATGLW